MLIKHFYLPLTIILPLLLSGCNKTPESSESAAIKKGSETSTVVPNEACKKLSAQMAEINNKSKIEALNQVNASLKECISTVNNTEQLKWLEESTAMYQRFLDTNGATEEQATAFVDYGFTILDQEQESADKASDQKMKGDAALFKQLAPRDQYLLNHQGQAYIELQYQGEGMFAYRRQPKYVLDLFATALPKDQKIFVERMAKDNQEIFFNDAAITISWSEMVERALFWENYLKQYPKSHFQKDAQKLLDEYRYFIFFGIDNTPVSDEYVQGEWINEDALKEIEKLAKRNDTTLNVPAKKFITFINTPISERNENNKVAPVDQDGYEKTSAQISHEQLRNILKLADPWQKEDYRDCHGDAVCLQYLAN